MSVDAPVGTRAFMERVIAPRLPMPASTALLLLREAGIRVSAGSLVRVRKQLGIRSQRVGFGAGAWWWVKEDNDE